MSECCMGCIHLTGGEIKHHRDCPNYLESMSETVDNLKAERDALQARGVALENTLRDAESHILQYKYAEGCSCCRDAEAHEHHEKELALLFGWPRFDDDSGWDWWSRREQMLEESSDE